MNKNKNKNFFALMVLGPPGSGKGTQIKLLAEKFGFHHSISSQVAKEYMESHTDPETLRQKERFEKGLLCEAHWMFRILKQKTEEILKQNKRYKGIIYDGSPRTLYEAEELYNFLLESLGKENIKIIEIDVGNEESKKRLKKRLICNKSDNHIFIRSDELGPGSACPECNGLLQERDLDKSELFDTRMSEYMNQTIPGLNYLKERHAVIKINGEQSIEDVHKDILKALNHDSY